MYMNAVIERRRVITGLTVADPNTLPIRKWSLNCRATNSGAAIDDGIRATAQ